MIKIQFLDGTAVRIQNWSTEPLTYKGKLWNYIAFAHPPLYSAIGEDAQSIFVDVPNIGSSQHAYLPFRDWAQSGKLSGAFIAITMFDPDKDRRVEQLYRIAERLFEEEGDKGAKVRLTLRQPDDRQCRVMTAVYDTQILGEQVLSRSY